MAIKLLPGVHVPHHKNTADMAPVRMPPPKVVKIPMSMHIGRPATPTVKPGDTVKVGTKIAEAGGFVSSPIYSSVSGTVKKLEDYKQSNGGTTQAIVIESDGEQTLAEDLRPREVTNLDEFVQAVADSGVVGLGGAGFPTAVKLKADPAKVDFILINGAECEPYITADTRTMLDNGERLVKGMKMLYDFYQPEHVWIGIENNKKKAIAHLTELAARIDGVDVYELPAMYPQGGEKVLIHNITGRIVPEGKLPLDVGCIVVNPTTLVTIMRFLEKGIPLVEKVLTVDGSAVKEPKNLIVPIGSSIRDVLEFAGGLKCEAKRIIMGGPMMGISIASPDEVVVKNTNAILALNEADATPPPTTPCIKCGRCISHCPLHLMPADIETAYQMNKPELLKELKVNLCMECGCCSYICPARRPLVQTNKLAKAVLNAYNAKLKADAEKKAAKEKEASA